MCHRETTSETIVFDSLNFIRASSLSEVKKRSSIFIFQNSPTLITHETVVAMHENSECRADKKSIFKHVFVRNMKRALVESF